MKIRVISRQLRAVARAPRTSVRSFSSTTSQQASFDPQVIVESFLSKFAKGQTFARKQLLDGNQLRLFSLTLDRPHIWTGSSSGPLEQEEPAKGTPLPAGYHLAYFTPAQLPGILGLDGTDASFNPDHPFTRRMWAGGSVHWPGADPSGSTKHYLKVGDVATEITRVLSCEAKTIRKTGETMLVVGVEKHFLDEKDNLCVVDKRNWVFRKALDPSRPAKIPPKAAELPRSEIEEQNQGMVVREFKRDVVQLFRMSALTFNAHRIHYDLPWATNVEGHRNVVVHGPLNQISMLDLWRDEMVRAGKSTDSDGIVFPKELSYRATSPVYAGEAYRILMPKDSLDKSETEIQAVSNDGTTCMKGTMHNWQ
ncbi:hypothetical protein H2198_006659 [Neophaeococcomyces mojaviensis]|uniref:Uncharacterized protein n=1 Tax=Neophaeococcomyces mojaviensis TaxID=3383035 RepID=A0ACC3A2A0_9EURO|nr:hypothetical protein H2198_006659 [Knufia sp. JES_112]